MTILTHVFSFFCGFPARAFSHQAKAFFLVFVLVFLTGCNPENYTQYPASSPFSETIGKTFQSLIPLKAHGIIQGKNLEGRVDYVVLTEAPGFSGQYVKFIHDLPSKMRFEITGAVHSSYWEPLERYYVVKILSDKSYEKYTILVPVSDNPDGTNLGLSPDIFSVL